MKWTSRERSLRSMSMTEGFAIAWAVVAALTAAPSPAIATEAEETDVFITPVYRVFNSYDGPHHFTTNIGERDDLVFYQGHVAIYLGNDEIIEAVQPVVRIRENPAYRPIIAVRRPFI